MKFDSKAFTVATYVLLPLSMAERVALSVRHGGDGGVRALKKDTPKKMNKCKFPFSGLEGKLVSGLDAMTKKKKNPKSAKLPSVCRNTDCYSDWSVMKSYIESQFSLVSPVTSISVGLCPGTIFVPDADYEIYVDRGIGALTNFEMVCCGLAGSCVVDGRSAEATPILARTDPLITLGDIGEVIFQGIKFQNVDSATVPVPTFNFLRPGAVISGLWPTVVTLNDVSVENINNDDTTSPFVSGLYFTQSLVVIDGGVYKSVSASAGVALNQGELFVRGVTFSDNLLDFSSNAFGGVFGSLSLQGVKAVVRDSVFQDNTGDCVGISQCAGAAIFHYGGSLKLNMNLFVANIVTDAGSGGAIGLFDVLLEAAENVFRENTSEAYGGAVYSLIGQSIFFDNLFELNSIPVNQSFNQGGGAIYSEGTISILVSNIFRNNSQKGTGTIFGDGGGALLLRGFFGATSASAYIEGNTFDSNISEADGGAIDIDGLASVFLTCNQFNSNAAKKGEGGAVDVYKSDVTSKGNEYAMNTSTNRGGAIRLWLSQMKSVEDVFNSNKFGTSMPLTINDIDMFQAIVTQSNLLITCDVSPVVVTGFSSGVPASGNANDFYLIDPAICDYLD